MTDDAEVVIFGQGAHMNTAKAVAARLRNLGEKVGVVRLRTFRPFPAQEILNRMSKFKAIRVLDNQQLWNLLRWRSVAHELRAALYDVGDKVKTVGFVAVRR